MTKKITLYKLNIILLLILIPILSLTFFFYMKITQDNVEKRGEEYLLNATTSAVRGMNSELRFARDYLSLAAKHAGAGYDSLREAYQEVSASVNIPFDYAEYIDAQGTIHNSAGLEMSVLDKPYFLAGMRGESGVCVELEPPFGREPSIILYAPVEKEGEIVGVILGEYLADNLIAHFHNEYFGHEVITLLCTSEGDVVAAEGLDDFDYMETGANLYSLRDTISMSKEQAGLVRDSLNGGDNCIISFFESRVSADASLCVAPLPEYDLALIRVLPGELNHDMSRDSIRVATIVWGVILLLFGGYLLTLALFFVKKRNALVREKEKLEEDLNRSVLICDAKNDFITHLSHEIRTPINSILGMNEMILRESQDKQIQEYGEHITNSGKLLLGLVNDVMDISRLEAGHLEIMQENLNLSRMLADLTGILKERCHSKGLEMNLDVDEKLPSVVLGDESHVKQVLINLITNAVKYTRGGYVGFSVHNVAGTKDGKARISFTVKDTGIGIKEEDLENLFVSFSRVDRKHNEKIDGTGLGLSIVKNLTEAMGGSVDVSSRYGYGSTFTVILPFSVVDDAPIGDFKNRFVKDSKGKKSIIQAPRARVLVVDDNATNRLIITKLFKRTHVKVDDVEDGKRCLEVCRKTQYNIIYMDHMMPSPDGIETFHMLREDEKSLNRMTPVVAVTANAMTNMREVFLNEGFNDYISKPVNPAALEETLRKYLPEDLIDGEEEVE